MKVEGDKEEAYINVDPSKYESVSGVSNVADLDSNHQNTETCNSETVTLKSSLATRCAFLRSNSVTNNSF